MKRLVVHCLMVLLAGLGPIGCHRSGLKEAPLTGRPTDPPTAMAARWESGRRYLYRVDVSSSAVVPRRNSGTPIRAETTLGQDLAFTISNAPAGGGKFVQMELLALQMETTKDDGVTMTFDSGNKAIFIEESPLVDRLQKLIGLRLRFILSQDNKVTRVDGLKELNDRMSAGGNSVRGVAAEVLRRFFNQQFFRDVVEMGLLPTVPVKIADTWRETRMVNVGLWGTGAPMELTLQFRGWQRRDGTNCARIDFSGTFKPPAVPPAPATNASSPTGPGPGPGPVRRLMGGSNDEGTLSGRTYYNPELSLAVETFYDQSLTRRSSSVRAANVARRGAPNPNPLPGTDPAQDTVVAAPPPGPPAAPGGPAPPRGPVGPNGPPVGGATNVVSVTTTNTSQWHVDIRLLEVETLPNPEVSRPLSP